MFGIGMPEMLLILAVALIVIGPKKLPDLARSLGKAMGEFKKATSELKESIQIDSELKEVKTTFDEIDRDLKKTSSSSADNGDTTPPDTGAQAQADPLETVKAAFDREDADGGESSLKDDPSAADAGPAGNTRTKANTPEGQQT